MSRAEPKPESSTRSAELESSQAGGARGTFLWLALIVWALLAWRFDFLCDDAFISFRYARNFAEGSGLVFHPGATAPVEGYSEFLWVLVLGIGMKLGIAPEHLARVLSFAASVGIVWLTMRLLQRSTSHGRARGLALLFLVTLPPLAVWSSGGMATSAFAFFILLAFERLHADREQPHLIGAALAASVAVLLRADGAFFVLAAFGPALLLSALRGDRSRARAALIAGLVAACVMALHMLWRHSVYGDWLPNTARAKLGFGPRAIERGGAYLGHALLTMPGLALAPLIGLLGLRRRIARVRVPMTQEALAFVVLTYAFAVLVGGDFMTFARFLVPALPFVAVALGGGLSAVLGARGARAGSVAIGLTVLLIGVDLAPAYGIHAVPERARSALHFRWNAPAFIDERTQWQNMSARRQEWADLGRALAQVVEPQGVIVYGAVGAIAYHSRLGVLDTNGLVTREVALREPLGSRRSPGHDKTVPPDFFLKDAPHVLEAFLWSKGKRVPFDVTGWLEYDVGEFDLEHFVDGDRLFVRPGPGHPQWDKSQ